MTLYSTGSDLPKKGHFGFCLLLAISANCYDVTGLVLMCQARNVTDTCCNSNTNH